MFEEVLIADDDPVSRRLLQVSLGNAGYRVDAAADGAEALRVLNQPDSPRLVILDWLMPGMDGVEVCRMVRASAREPYQYIILLTAKGHQTEIIEGLEAGADDYITKPFDLQELKARLRAGKRILELQEQLVSAREQLRIQATHDSLTGLFNRRAIEEALDREATRCRREKKPVGVILADVDHFKLINDTYGHQAGDAVLQEIARRMSASLRAYDSVGRYGGEEFLVVVPGSDLAAAAELAERLRQGIAAQPVSTDSAMIPVTVSLGVAVSADQPGGLEDLLRRADEALYAAKDRGRNRVETALGQEESSQRAEVRQA
jgi:two-component system, cell cycle response regulator